MKKIKAEHGFFQKKSEGNGTRDQNWIKPLIKSKMMWIFFPILN